MVEPNGVSTYSAQSMENPKNVVREELIPNAYDTRVGIERRKRIRELKALGWSNPKIAGDLDISGTALYKHLRKIEAEDAAAQEDGQGAA